MLVLIIIISLFFCVMVVVTAAAMPVMVVVKAGIPVERIDEIEMIPELKGFLSLAHDNVY